VIVVFIIRLSHGSKSHSTREICKLALSPLRIPQKLPNLHLDILSNHLLLSFLRQRSFPVAIAHDCKAICDEDDESEEERREEAEWDE